MRGIERVEIKDGVAAIPRNKTVLAHAVANAALCSKSLVFASQVLLHRDGQSPPLLMQDTWRSSGFPGFEISSPFSSRSENQMSFPGNHLCQ